jgi:hypothetical protein
VRTGHRAALPVEPRDPTDTGLAFDPAAHTIAEVQSYVEHNPAQCKAVYAAEEAGKARVRLLDWLRVTCWPEGQAPA